MQSTVTVIRGAAAGDPFTQILNSALRDKRLSFAARGVLAHVLSFPENWRFGADSLAEAGPDGRRKLLGVLKELEEHGYLVRIKSRSASGTFVTQNVISDKPARLPKVQNGTPVAPKVRKSTPVKRLVKPKCSSGTSVNRTSVESTPIEEGVTKKVKNKVLLKKVVAPKSRNSTPVKPKKVLVEKYVPTFSVPKKTKPLLKKNDLSSVVKSIIQKRQGRPVSRNTIVNEATDALGNINRNTIVEVIDVLTSSDLIKSDGICHYFWKVTN